MLAGELLQSRGPVSRPAIEFDGGSECWTYEALDGLANRFARYFLAQGLTKGDRVSFLVGNDPLLVGAYFGAFRAGLVANPVNTRLTATEIAYVLEHAGSRCVVAGAELCDALAGALEMLAQRPHVVALRTKGDAPTGMTDGEVVLATSSERIAGGPIGDDDGALLIYTSGTTGNPKGVVLTHANVVAGVTIVHRVFEITPDERTLCVMPLFHTNALMFSTLPFLYGGGTVCLEARFSATRFWQQCRDARVTGSSASPTILGMLLAHEATAPPRGQTGLRYIKVASAPTSIDLAERFEARFGDRLLIETYGLTETTAFATMNPLHAPRHFGSIGQEIPPQALAILGDDGIPRPNGEVGEIGIRGATVMKEYFRDPENTERAFVGPWFRTGDMAMRDDEGFVRIVGRKKEMILRGGENISPLEVENVAMLHPKVKEAVAVGLADALWGEVVGLCVVAHEPVEPADIVAFCRERLSAFKLPERIVFTDELPRNAMGKIMRSAARASFVTDPGSR
jgi:acyl-CoA synthetase (AMP-forming)/AMP-acid ligase II